MKTIRNSYRFMSIGMLVALLFSMAVPVQPVLAATNTVYDAIPAILAPNYQSVGFQATQTAEFGDYIHLAGTYRGLSSVTVTMSTWALNSTYPTMPAGGWNHPITLNIYNVIPGAPLNTKGALIATKTQSVLIPWRPEADPTCAGGTAWRAGNGTCYNGYAFNITFDMSSLKVTLPNDIIVGVAYNTQTWGYAPIGVAGPYNSLNVAVTSVVTPATVGTDDSTDRVFWNTSTAGWYTDGGAAGVGVFREDTAWTPNGTVLMRVVADDGLFPTTISSVPASSAVLATGPNQLTFTFSEDVLHDGSAVAADNIINYLLFEDGSDNVFNTIDCAGGVSVLDTNIVINAAGYDAGTFTATLNVNGGVPLPAGTYRLLACGTTSIQDPDGYELNNGLADSIVNFSVLPPAAAAAGAAALPATGFAPGMVTVLPAQTVSYAAMGDLWLEIPSLGVRSNIVGVPMRDGTWDVSWLGGDTGWLNGTAFPTWEGNSVLTSHVYKADGTAGPFLNLRSLGYGDQVIVHAYGQRHTFEVRNSRVISPGNTAYTFQHLEGYSYLTLVTCQGYEPSTGEYRWRRVVRAVLVDVTNE